MRAKVYRSKIYRAVGGAAGTIAATAVALGLILCAAAQARDKGWWVVVGSLPSEPSERQSADLRRMSAAARRCGVRVFNDTSGKFVGFRPGLNVFVIGAYASRPAAERVQAVARRCFPGAYLKHGRYLGE
jgi:hypothetical protein